MLRTISTALAVGFTVFLLVGLWQYLHQIDYGYGLAPDAESRLVTRHAASVGLPFPAAYRAQIEDIPGVKDVTPLQWIIGYCRDPKVKTFHAYAIDPYSGLRLISDFKFNPREVEAFQRDPEGAIVANELMDRFGWRIGDRVKVVARVFPSPLQIGLTLKVYGTYGPGSTAMWIHYDYFNAVLRRYMPERADQLNTLSIGLRNPSDAPRIAKEIDALFRQTTYPTTTESAKAFLVNFGTLWGNLTYIFIPLVSVIVLQTLLVQINALVVPAVSSKSADPASNRGMLLALVGRSTFVAVAGALMGLTAAKLLFDRIDIFGLTSMIHHLDINTPGMAKVLTITVLSGALSGLLVGYWRTSLCRSNPET